MNGFSLDLAIFSCGDFCWHARRWPFWMFRKDYAGAAPAFGRGAGHLACTENFRRFQ